MIVDCHTHIDFSTGDSAASEHLAAAETVDFCIVLANPDQQNDNSNKELSEYVEKHKERMAGFAVVCPVEEKAVAENLTVIKDKLALKGIVLYCSAVGMHPAHSKAMRFYESVQELGLPVFFHNSDMPGESLNVLEYAQPVLLDEVAREFPSLKIIIGSMGMPFMEQTFLMLAKHKNVFADLTIRPKNIWQTYNTVIAAYEHGVMDKLLFGSGFPAGSAGACIETLLGFNMTLADTKLPMVPRSNIRSVIERNTLELLGIDSKTTVAQQ
jgi:uncharacterized protein